MVDAQLLAKRACARLGGGSGYGATVTRSSFCVFLEVPSYTAEGNSGLKAKTVGSAISSDKAGISMARLNVLTKKTLHKHALVRRHERR